MDSDKELASALSSVLQVISSREFLIIVPVFNAKDAWNAAKIANSKLKQSNAKLVTCVPYHSDYICIFKSVVKPQTNFPVYKVSSERKAV